jgi:hypothetical protein
MATISSNGTGGGVASAGASWSGGVVPTNVDAVVIQAGDTITVDGTYTWGDSTSTSITVYGILKASRTVSSTLNVRGQLIIKNNGEIDYGKSTDAISSTYNAILKLNGKATTPSNAEFGLVVDAGGKFFFYGATSTTNTTLTSTLSAGSNFMQVADSTGWQIGAEVAIMTSTTSATQTEVVLVTSILGNTVSFFPNASYTHSSGISVGYFGQNVLITSVNSTIPTYVQIKCNNTNSADEAEIGYTLIKNMGAGSSSSKFGFQLISGNNTNLIWKSFSNVAFKNSKGYTCLDMINQAQPIEVSDCAFYNTVGYSLYFRSGSTGTFSNIVIYRGNTNGINSAYSQGGAGVVINDSIFGGISGYNVAFGAGCGFIFNRCRFLTATACYLGFGTAHTFNNCIFGTASAPLYRWFSCATNAVTSATCNDCTFITPSNLEVYNTVNTNDQFYLRISNKNIDPLEQTIYTNAGEIHRDNSTYKTGVASVRFDPITATKALFFDLKIFAPSDQPVVVSGYLRKNSSYGSSNLPYVKLHGLGITEDTYTMTDIDDTWVQFKVQATQTTGTDGMLTLTTYAQSSGSGASAWIDNVVAYAPEAVNSGDFGYWSNAQPVEAILANFVSALDVWNVLTSELTLTGSIGKQLVDDSDVIADIKTETDKIQTVDDNVDAVKLKTDNLPTDPADQSDVETAITSAVTSIKGSDGDDLKDISDQLDTVQTDLDNPNQYKADVSALATESNATTNTTNIITEVNANEVKIDSITTTLSTLVADIWAYATRTLSSFGSLVSDVTDAVWDEPTSSHQVAGTTGKALTDAGATADPQAIADAVWDELLSGHSVSGSFGELVKRIAGLTQDNYAVLNPVYDTVHTSNLISADIKIYPTATDVTNDTNAIDTFTILSTYDAMGRLLTYKVKRT